MAFKLVYCEFVPQSLINPFLAALEETPVFATKKCYMYNYVLIIVCIHKFWCKVLYWWLPVIGWVCYAEKTHGTYILPYISTTKSPQQVMGSLVKERLAGQLGVTPDRIYHVTIMPCFDKKLEASRQDFYSDLYSSRDVDCVISTSEYPP